MKHKLVLGIFLAIAVIMLIIIIAVRSCGEDKKPVNAVEVKSENLSVSVVADSDGEPVFSVSVDDFTESFNSLYRRDKNNDYFPPIDEWYTYVTDGELRARSGTEIIY